MKILHITASPNPKSVSKAVSDDLLKHLKNKYENCTVNTRDLTVSPYSTRGIKMGPHNQHLLKRRIPHFNTDLLNVFFLPDDKLTDEQRRILKLSDKYINDIINADIIIISTPMHNFTIPSTLKAWIDHVVRVNKTFKYTEKGRVGMVDSAKKVYLVIASAGVYNDENSKMDFASPYLQMMMNYIGLTDVTTIRAEGVQSKGREKVLESAHESIVKI